MNIIPIPALKDNYIWIVINDQRNLAIIVDPGEAQPVSNFLQQNKLQLSAILITHHHWDHTNGIGELVQQYAPPVYGPANDGMPNITFALQEGDTVAINGFPTFTCIDIPGHTRGHIAYYATDGILFCGDTLFAAGCGRLFEGTAEEMYISLQKITALADDTSIYCAHEYTLNNLRFAQHIEPNNIEIINQLKLVSELRKKNLPTLPSSLQIEKNTNPFLRCHLPEIKARMEEIARHSLLNPVDVFTCLRKYKDNY